ncbi:type II secretion system F family protein [Demequina sp. B12]|uniref:type II secretion system F family protein n=1 Tax=Demequina sp. B12 TaxID=2992757 RepID=UPI00237BBC2E|nr:type II secretion system F family protein [Demequina sp. B12]MDE0573596.1 type II secretion system F family protein [Demequina sp. B12]
MGAVWGLVLGVGLCLVWWSWWPLPQDARVRSDGWHARTADRLVLAGAGAVTPQGLIATAVALGALVLVVALGLTGSPIIALCFAVLASRAPFALVAMRARQRVQAARHLWPDAVDTLASGIRAGLALPEAISQLGERGPRELREPFVLFAADYRASGRFGDCLDLLKARLADPVADRIVETLRLTRDVGGTDVGHVLRTLAEFLREDARVRGELEARQSWTVNAARLAVAAPWVLLALLAARGGNADAYNSAAGVLVLGVGGGCTVVAYRLMMRAGRLTTEQRVLR